MDGEHIPLLSISEQLERRFNSDQYEFREVNGEHVRECKTCKNIVILEDEEVIDDSLEVVGRKKIYSVKEQLVPGDHLAVWKKLFWHHMLVVAVNNDESLTVIHYRGLKGNLNPLRKGVVAEDSGFRISEQGGLPYKIIYNKDVPNVRAILSRAHKRLGEKKYIILTRNCEHFVTDCKTGKAESQQAIQCCKHTIISTIQQGVSSLYSSFIDDIALFLFASPIDDLIVAGGRKLIKKNADIDHSDLNLISIIALIALITFTEVCVLCKTICKAHNDKKEKYIDQEDFCNTAIGKFLKSIYRAAGAIAGTLIGVYALSPKAFWRKLVGGTIGGFVGTILGHHIGSLVDREVTKIRSFNKFTTSKIFMSLFLGVMAIIGMLIGLGMCFPIPFAGKKTGAVVGMFVGTTFGYAIGSVIDGELTKIRSINNDRIVIRNNCFEMCPNSLFLGSGALLGILVGIFLVPISFVDNLIMGLIGEFVCTTLGHFIRSHVDYSSSTLFGVVGIIVGAVLAVFIPMSCSSDSISRFIVVLICGLHGATLGHVINTLFVLIDVVVSIILLLYREIARLPECMKQLCCCCIRLCRGSRAEFG